MFLMAMMFAMFPTIFAMVLFFVYDSTVHSNELKECKKELRRDPKYRYIGEINLILDARDLCQQRVDDRLSKVGAGLLGVFLLSSLMVWGDLKNAMETRLETDTQFIEQVETE